MASRKIAGREVRKKRAEIDVTDEILKPQESLQIREMNWTSKQRTVIDTILDKDNKITIIDGKAGTGKSTLSLFCALQLLKEKVINRVVIIRVPVESCQHKIGYLPGLESEKLQPYFQFADDILGGLISKIELNALKANGSISIIPMGFLRGLSFNNCFVLVEEASDYSLDELEVVMGRFGRGSKLVLSGDPRQSNARSSGFEAVYNCFDSPESQSRGINCFKFETSDCVRSGITKFILDKFEKLNP